MNEWILRCVGKFVVLNFASHHVRRRVLSDTRRPSTVFVAEVHGEPQANKAAGSEPAACIFNCKKSPPRTFLRFRKAPEVGLEGRQAAK
jgi:hypothetical protein